MEPEMKVEKNSSPVSNSDERVVEMKGQDCCSCANTALQKDETPKKNNKIKAIIAIFMVVAVAICGFGYYEYIYKHTPKYTLMLIGKSVKEKNVQEFNQHVDVKSIVANYLDDQYESDPKLAANPFAKVLWNALSNVAQGAVQDRVNDMVAGKEITNNDKGSENPLVKDVERKIKVKEKLSLVQVDKLVTNPDGSAEVKVVFKDNEKNKEHTAFLMMKPLDNGTWQIYKIKNLNDLLKE